MYGITAIYNTIDIHSQKQQVGVEFPLLMVFRFYS